ncbi:hypothetical protein V8G54_002635 [Vigna mungo]|uniref:Uncharacterized protein n=1 Tax=Vigna mungo TaxID=3915 RepID=A0AAQ3SCT3_VIGMU
MVSSCWSRESQRRHWVFRGSWAGFFECRVEDGDAREEMMEKKTIARRSNLEDDLAVVDGATATQSGSHGAAWHWCFNGGSGSLRIGGEDGGDTTMSTICGFDGGGHGGSRLATRLMVVEIGFGGDKVGGSGDKVGGSDDKGSCAEVGGKADVADEGGVFGVVEGATPVPKMCIKAQFMYPSKSTLPISKPTASNLSKIEVKARLKELMDKKREREIERKEEERREEREKKKKREEKERREEERREEKERREEEIREEEKKKEEKNKKREREKKKKKREEKERREEERREEKERREEEIREEEKKRRRKKRAGTYGQSTKFVEAFFKEPTLGLLKHHQQGALSVGARFTANGLPCSRAPRCHQERGAQAPTELPEAPFGCIFHVTQHVFLDSS